MQSRPIGFSTIGRGLQWTLEGLAGSVLFALMLLTTGDVLGRFLFNMPIVGTVELTQLMLAALVFLALPVVSWREGHIAVDLVDTIFPRGLIWVRQLLVNGFSAVALWVVARRSWALGERAIDWGDRTQFLHLPVGYFIYGMSILLAISAVLCGIRALLYLMEGLRILDSGGPLSAGRDQ
ncbi:MAG: TRAP transporter small permease [Ectothiorhodospiraceae bacterium]|nr:TRAP transporter small permease [Ectothiorhodospiraceae bacterium]